MKDEEIATAVRKTVYWIQIKQTEVTTKVSVENRRKGFRHAQKNKDYRMFSEENGGSSINNVLQNSAHVH